MDGSDGPEHTGEPPLPGSDPCNGRDDDQDGEIDEDDRQTWFADVDLDGVGDASSAIVACDPGPGWSLVSGDCDDSDADLAEAVDPAHHWVDRSVERGFAGLGPRWDGQRVCLRDTLGGGVAAADLDGDGHEDVFVPGTGVPHEVMWGDGRGNFRRETLGTLPRTRSSGALVVDLDGDADLDLVVPNLDDPPLQVLINDGSGHFTDEAGPRGLDWQADLGICGDWFGVSAADVDGDGDLDLFVAGWEEGLSLGRRSRSRLYRNDGSGVFTNVTALWGVDATWDRGVYGAVFHDWDDDGDVDAFLVADWNGSTTLENVGGRFVLAADESVFTDDNGMGADLGDPDGDGDLDLFLTSIWADPLAGCSSNPASDCSGNRMYGWDRDQFVDETDRAAVRRGQWNWGTTFFDFDLDGAEDLLLTGGFESAIYEHAVGTVYRNTGSGRFADWTCRTGFTWRGQGRGVIAFDADEDGDEDVVVTGRQEPPAFFENAGPAGHALHLELRQPGPNPFAVGAVVRVATVKGAPPHVAAVHANAQYTSTHGPWVHLGLGVHEGPVAVEVTWPDGQTTRHADVPQGRVVLQR